MTDRETLAARIEAADASEQRAMLMEAFRAINRNGDMTPQWWQRKFYRFSDLLDAEAYLDAAMMLVPESCSIGSQQRRPWEPHYVALRCHTRHETFDAKAKTYALALAAAAIRAGGA